MLLLCNCCRCCGALSEKDQQAGQQQPIKQQQILKPKPATEVMKESSDYPPAPKECNAMEFTE
jgi:hypothetical protein